MKKSFYQNLTATQTNVSITENGAVGYKTEGHALVDFNFKVSSYRGNARQGASDFQKVLKENEAYALKYLFYLRDIREGLGERALFRACLAAFISSNFSNKDEVVNTIIKETPTFGRCDDLLVFVGTPYESRVFALIKETLASDFINFQAGRPITLLAKWLPSANASSKETKAYANRIITALGTTPREYRKTLSTLRGYLNVVETNTCAKKWDEIDYNAVPSKANIKYADAFLRNDETRRRQYLSDLVRGTDKDGNVVKINSSVNFAHDVLHMYLDNTGWSRYVSSYDETVEQLWKNLKQVPGLDDTIVVRDGSGSMTQPIGKTNITALEVATALSIYCAQHLKNEAYRDRIITFSAHPEYIDFSNKNKYGSLNSIYKYVNTFNECSNTNIEAVFDLILKTAVENKLSQDDLPKQILIISDMEFDGATCSRPTVSLFNTIANRFAQYGYKLPKLVFWNVCSRTGTIPCKVNDLGVLLISGFSVNILNMVNNGQTDPYDALIAELNKERYNAIPLITYRKERPANKAKKVLIETPAFLK